MRICCPNCLTLYDIDRKSLDHAAGMANCYRCHQVFNAFENKLAVRKDEELTPSGANLTDDFSHGHVEEAKAAAAPEQEQGPEQQAVTAEDSENTGTEYTPAAVEQQTPSAASITDDTLPRPAEEPQAQAAPEQEATAVDESEDGVAEDVPAAVQMDIDEQISRADLELDLANVLAESEQLPEPEDGPPIDFDEFTPAPPQHITEPKASTGRKVTLGLGVVVFSLAAAAQLSWLHWDRVSTHPQGQKLIQQACDWLSCELPPRRRPDRFVILQRDLKPVLNPPGALALHILLSNDADFAQPPPVLELTFLDYDNSALARRRFQPNEYLYPANGAETLITPRQPVSIEMLLLDPGPQAAGFRLEFL